MWYLICGKNALIVHKITSKNMIYKIWTARGYFLAITQFVKQFTPVPRHPRTENRKLKLKFRENCFGNVVSDLVNIKLFLYNNTSKIQKLKKIKPKKHGIVKHLCRIVGTKLVFLVDF